MTPYVFVKLVHVLAAVLGLGMIGATGLMASARATVPGDLLVLSRWSSVGLVIMFTTGAGLNIVSGGAFHQLWWFRLSGLSLIATGAIVGLSRRQLRRWSSGELQADRARRHVARSSWVACALVAWITVLMELRPFR